MVKKPTYKELTQKVKKLEQEAIFREQAEEAFRKSEEKYRLLVKNLPSIVYQGHVDWSVEFFDSKIELLTGYSVDEFNLGKLKWKDIILNEDVLNAKEIFIRALKSDRSYIREYRIESKAEDIRWIQERGQIICNNTGRIEYVSGVFFDITDYKQAEEELRKSEEMARALLDATTDAVVLLDSRGTILDINDTYAQRFQKHKDHMLGLCIWNLSPPEITVLKMANVQKVFESGRPVRIVDEQKGIWNDTNIYPVCNAKGKVMQVAVFARDITERKIAEEHVHTLTQQLMKVQEIERQQIAYDLHDNLAQDLSLLGIGLETLFDSHPSVPLEVKQKASELSKTLRRSISAVRDMSYDLHPPELDQLGIAHTAYQYCEEFSEKSGIKIDFFAAGLDDLTIPNNTEINLYRLIQEALWNIKKHADATNVTIKLVASFPYIILRIEDDGKGFNVKDRLAAASKEKRMGLRSMEQRVSLLDGKMRIQSRPKEGTKVYIEIPYKEKKRG
ncbi:MAG: PAS domain S-box protein [Deltaproteobacteria bacterium]